MTCRISVRCSTVTLTLALVLVALLLVVVLLLTVVSEEFLLVDEFSPADCFEGSFWTLVPVVSEP